MSNLYQLLIYQPLFNLLIFFYNLCGNNLGWSVIVVTFLLRLLLWPWYQKNAFTQRLLSRLQSKFSDIQKKYKSDPQQQTKEMMALYRQYKINPSGLFLFMVVQFVLLYALFRLFQNILAKPNFNIFLYHFISAPASISTHFFGLDLAQPNFILAIILALAQHLQSKISFKTIAANKMTRLNQSLVLYFMPAFIFVIYLKLPAILGLYWFIMVLFGFIQETIANRQFSKWNEQQNIK